MSDVCVYCFMNTHPRTHTHKRTVAGWQQSRPLHHGQLLLLDKTQKYEEHRIKEQIEMDKLPAKHQFHNLTSEIATKTSLKPKAQEFMMRYGISEKFGEDKKRKIFIVFFSLNSPDKM